MGQYYSLPMALHEEKKCDECMTPSYKEYIDQFHIKYKKELDIISKLNNEYINYYEIHRPNPANKKQGHEEIFKEAAKKMKIYDKITYKNQLLLSKLITNKEYIHMTNVYLQCSKNKCKRYYKEYIKILEITLRVIFNDMYREGKEIKKMHASDKKIYQEIIHFAKTIGINTDAINKEVKQQIDRMRRNLNMLTTATKNKTKKRK